MDTDDLYSRPADDTVVLRVHLQPGAGRTAVVGRHGDALKVRVAAPPQDGRANDACVALLAETFGIPAAAVDLVSGETSQSKAFKLSDLDFDEFRHRLEQAIEAGTTGPGPDSRSPGRH